MAPSPRRILARPGRTVPGGQMVVGPLVDPAEFPELEIAAWMDARGAVLHMSLAFRLQETEFLRDLRTKWEAVGRPKEIEATTARLATALTGALPGVSVRQIATPPSFQRLQRTFAEVDPERANPQARAERAPSLCAYYAPEVMRAGARISQMEPWEVFDERQHFVIEVPSVGLTHKAFIVVGASGEQRGVVGYRSREDVLRSRGENDEARRLLVAGTVLGALFDDAFELGEGHTAAFVERGYGHLTYFPVGLWLTPDAPSALPIHDVTACRSLAAAMEAFAEAVPLLMRRGLALPKSVSVTTPTFGSAEVTLHPIAYGEGEGEDEYDDDGDADGDDHVYRGPHGVRVPAAVGKALVNAAGVSFSPVVCPLREGDGGMAYAHMNQHVKQLLVERQRMRPDAPAHGRILAHLGYAADVRRMIPWFGSCERFWMVEYDGLAYVFVQTSHGLQLVNAESAFHRHMGSVRDEGIRDGFVWLGAFSGGPRPRMALRLNAMEVIVKLPFQYVRV